jgi:hypothetical protein
VTRARSITLCFLASVGEASRAAHEPEQPCDEQQIQYENLPPTHVVGSPLDIR